LWEVGSCPGNPTYVIAARIQRCERLFADSGASPQIRKVVVKLMTEARAELLEPEERNEAAQAPLRAR